MHWLGKTWLPGAGAVNEPSMSPAQPRNCAKFLHLANHLRLRNCANYLSQEIVQIISAKLSSLGQSPKSVFEIWPACDFEGFPSRINLNPVVSSVTAKESEESWEGKHPWPEKCLRKSRFLSETVSVVNLVRCFCEPGEMQRFSSPPAPFSSRPAAN